MNIARERISAEEPGEPGELHRLPDREPGEDLHADTEDHCSVKETLHRIVMAETMREPEKQRVAKVAQHGARSSGSAVAPAMPRYRAIGEIGEPVREQHPHDGDMPGDPAGEPAPERQTPGKGGGEGWRRVIDRPAT